MFTSKGATSSCRLVNFVFVFAVTVALALLRGRRRGVGKNGQHPDLGSGGLKMQRSVLHPGNESPGVYLRTCHDSWLLSASRL